MLNVSTDTLKNGKVIWRKGRDEFTVLEKYVNEIEKMLTGLCQEEEIVSCWNVIYEDDTLEVTVYFDCVDEGQQGTMCRSCLAGEDVIEKCMNLKDMWEDKDIFHMYVHMSDCSSCIDTIVWEHGSYENSAKVYVLRR